MNIIILLFLYSELEILDCSYLNIYFFRLLIEAGAVALGLKTITTRNLALAWRSLQLLLMLLPKLNTHFSTLLKSSIVNKHVDQV